MPYIKLFLEKVVDLPIFGACLPSEGDQKMQEDKIKSQKIFMTLIVAKDSMLTLQPLGNVALLMVA